MMSEENQKGFGPFFLAIPWPWHLALGVAAYLILHLLGTRQLPPPDQSPIEISLYAHRLMWKTMAAIFQYVLPVAFGLLSILSFRKARMIAKGKRKN